MKHIAFATSKENPFLTPDDKVLAACLNQNGFKVYPAVWNDSSIEWDKFDLVILRSMWDYHLHYAEFIGWLDVLAGNHIRVFNSVTLVKWNANKQYLSLFEKIEIKMPSFEYCRKSSDILLSEILLKHKWSKAVVKPAVSCGSYNTWMVSQHSNQKDEEMFSDMLLKGDVIVQQFMEEILDAGEVSLIYFNKKFSHAVCKKAIQGEFRVQQKFGGTVTPVIPGKKTMAIAAKILEHIEAPLLYARIDGVLNKEGDLWLMEIELTEPNLFFSFCPDACKNFMEALKTFW